MGWEYYKAGIKQIYASQKKAPAIFSRGPTHNNCLTLCFKGQFLIVMWLILETIWRDFSFVTAKSFKVQFAGDLM